MARRRGKSISFDAMVKFFLQNYNIPTKRDIEKLVVRLDRLEDLIVAAAASGKRRRVARGDAGKNKASLGTPALSGSDTVLEIIKGFRQGAGFGDIKNRTGFPDKKLRNIIFRLTKLGRIKRKTRGLYIVA